ncbi:MAG: glycosyltransferase family 4 protein [bacterium]
MSGVKCQVLEILEATTGGTRRHLMDVVTSLNPSRFQVTVACSARRDPAFFNDIALMRAKCITVHLIPMRRAISPFSDLLALLRLVSLMRHTRFDVVHTHSSKAGFLGRLAARLTGVPRIIHTPHTFPFQMKSSRPIRFAYFHLERFAARFTDRIICVCPSQRVIAQQLTNPARAVVIENGIGAAPPPDMAERHRRRLELGIATGCLVAGMVGRFTLQKGHVHFIAAARQVAARLPAVRFVLVGDGELKQRIERSIAAAGLQERFIILGAREDVPELVPLFDVVVLPSLWEGLPYVLLDAMSAGKPVIASSVAGMADVITNGDNGLLVPPEDPTALADAMLKLLENGKLRSTMGNRARESLRHRCRLEDMIERLSSVYEGRL